MDSNKGLRVVGSRVSVNYQIENFDKNYYASN